MDEDEAQQFAHRAVLGRTAQKELIARIERQPRELYWRSRLIEGQRPGKSQPAKLRKLLLDSAVRLMVADPDWFIRAGPPYLLLSRWSVQEVETLLKGFTCRPRALEHRTRAKFWLTTAHRSRDKRAFLLEARRELEAIPPRHRGHEHAELLGSVLRRLDMTEFAAAVPTLTRALNFESPVTDSLLLGWMSHLLEADQPEAYAHLAATFQRLPIHLRSGRARVVFNNLEGLVALRRRDLHAAARCLEEMIALAPQASFLGNDDTMTLARALAKEGLLLADVARYVDAALISDWRAWVRPQLEAFKRSLGA